MNVSIICVGEASRVDFTLRLDVSYGSWDSERICGDLFVMHHQQFDDSYVKEAWATDDSVSTSELGYLRHLPINSPSLYTIKTTSELMNSPN